MNVPALEHPLNVVVFLPKGVAENYECSGPMQLREWMGAGRVHADTRVFCRRKSKWMSVQEYLRDCREKTELQQLDDMEHTLTDLVGVAEELKRISELMSLKGKEDDGQGNVGVNREAVRATRDTDTNDDYDSGPILGAGTGDCAY